MATTFKTIESYGYSVHMMPAYAKVDKNGVFVPAFAGMASIGEVVAVRPLEESDPLYKFNRYMMWTIRIKQEKLDQVSTDLNVKFPLKVGIKLLHAAKKAIGG